MRAAALALLAAAALAAPALAQESLYGPQPPRDSAWLRVVNALPAEASVQADSKPPQALGTARQQRIGAYTVVEAVENRAVKLSARTAGRSATLDLPLKPGTYTTALLSAGPDGAPVLHAWTDTSEFNQLRARLSFYNAVPGCPGAALTMEGGAAIMKDVAPNTAAMRSVNPVATTLQAGCPGGASAPVALEGMEAGGLYSVWLMPDGQGVTAFLARDTITAWQRPAR